MNDPKETGLAYSFEECCKRNPTRPFFQLVANSLLTWPNYNRIKPETLRWLGVSEREIESIREVNKARGIE
jgi:hypothetical protein